MGAVGSAVAESQTPVPSPQPLSRDRERGEDRRKYQSL